jgi:intracellular septation protein
MKFLFDLFPVILFFITLKIAEKTATAGQVLAHILGTVGIVTTVKPDLVPIMLATIAVIIASIGQILWVKLRHGKVDNALYFSAILVVVLGSMTLYFQDDTFIKWKPTVLDWAFAVVLLLAEVIWGKNIIKSMMGKEIKLPEKIWKALNFAWVVFFAVMGLANIYVAFNYSIDTWASFKLFGTMGLMFVFIVAQSLWFNKYIISEE